MNMHIRYILTALVAIAGLTFAAGVTRAGFEYVPPSSGKPSAPAEAPGPDVLTPPPAQSAPVQPVETQPLPLPAHLPVSIPAAEHSVAGGVLVAPAGMTPQPQKPVSPTSETLLKVKTIASPSVPPSVAPAPAPQGIQWNPQIPAKPQNILAEPALAPPRTAVTAPVAVAPATERKPLAIPPGFTDASPSEKIVMPSDAPSKAAEAAPKLLLNPFPKKDKNPAAADTVVAEPTAMPAAAAPETAAFDAVEGFGSDMPLALALQQIAPPGYTFSFGDGVNPGVRVSWEGGSKPWNQVIDDTLKPLGLSSEVRGMIVHIKNPASASALPAEKPTGKLGALDEKSAADTKSKPVKTAFSAQELRRKNVKDPGESAKPQPISIASAEAAAAIEPTSGSPKTTSPAAEPKTTVSAKPAIPPVELASVEPPKDDTKHFFSTPGIWKAAQGENLKDILGAWSKQAGVALIWNATHDYVVESAMTLDDSFQTAVQTIVDKGVKGENKPVFTFEDPAAQGKSGILIVEDKS